jgi:hypothetical protein
VDDQHLEADRTLQRPDPFDDLVGGADWLGGAARGEARVDHADVGGLALESQGPRVEALKGRGTLSSPEFAGGDGDLRREWSAHGRS